MIDDTPSQGAAGKLRTHSGMCRLCDGICDAATVRLPPCPLISTIARNRGASRDIPFLDDAFDVARFFLVNVRIEDDVLDSDRNGVTESMAQFFSVEAKAFAFVVDQVCCHRPFGTAFSARDRGVIGRVVKGVQSGSSRRGAPVFRWNVEVLHAMSKRHSLFMSFGVLVAFEP